MEGRIEEESFLPLFGNERRDGRDEWRSLINVSEKEPGCTSGVLMPS